MKSNNTAASIILGSGIALVAVGTLINYTSIVIDELPNGETIIGLGLATTLVSIPLFIAGNNHKNKAQIQLKKGAIGLPRLPTQDSLLPTPFRLLKTLRSISLHSIFTNY